MNSLPRRTVLAGLAASWAMSVHAATPSVADWGGMEFVDRDGRRFRLGDSEARLTLIKLWASWCPACLGELPRLEAARPALRQRGIDVVLVSSPQDWAADLHVAAARAPGLHHARLSDSNAPNVIRSALFGADGWFYVPRSMLFDRSRGRVVWSHLGGLDWRGEPWRAKDPAGA